MSYPFLSKSAVVPLSNLSVQRFGLLVVCSRKHNPCEHAKWMGDKHAVNMELAIEKNRVAHFRQDAMICQIISASFYFAVDGIAAQHQGHDGKNEEVDGCNCDHELAGFL